MNASRSGPRTFSKNSASIEYIPIEALIGFLNAIHGDISMMIGEEKISTAKGTRVICHAMYKKITTIFSISAMETVSKYLIEGDEKMEEWIEHRVIPVDILQAIQIARGKDMNDDVSIDKLSKQIWDECERFCKMNIYERFTSIHIGDRLAGRNPIVFMDSIRNSLRGYHIKQIGEETLPSGKFITRHRLMMKDKPVSSIITAVYPPFVTKDSPSVDKENKALVKPWEFLYPILSYGSGDSDCIMLHRAIALIIMRNK